MSKAFTKEDDDAGFSMPSSSLLAAVPSGPFRLTSAGFRLAEAAPDPRIREALARAERVPPIANPERAALGVTVRVRDPKGSERTYRLVSAEERGLLGDGCSVDGPIGRALLGAQVGDICEVSLPRGLEELEVIALDGEPS